MAENSKIEWTHHTFNPWRGCTKVSEGCRNCYADTMSHRNPKTLGVWGLNGTRVVAAEAAWREPVKWDRAAKAAGERHRVFCASLADVFEDWQGEMSGSDGRRLYEQTPQAMPMGLIYTESKILTMQDVRRRLFGLIDATPNLDWLLLTKRPENILSMVPRAWTSDGSPGQLGPTQLVGSFPHNVWLGTSVENQAAADERIPHLLKVPAAVRFLSMEPLLGPVDLSKWLRPNPATEASRRIMSGSGWRPDLSTQADIGIWQSERIHWAIVGGESGHGARPMHPAWARSIRDQCQAAGVAFHFKQWGEWLPQCNDPANPREYEMFHISGHRQKSGDGVYTNSGWTGMGLVGKKVAGRLLDGREWDELPENHHAR